jgi:hypothetical protein
VSLHGTIKMNPVDTTTVSIPLSKTKIAWVVLGCAVFVLGSFWLWSIAETQDRYHPLYVQGVALVCGSLAGLCGIVKMVGSPINIATNALKVKLDDLERLMNEAFAIHKGRGRTETGHR